MTKTIHGLRPYVTDATSYHGERPYPPSYLAALLQEILGHMPQPVGLTRDQKLAEFLGLPQAAFSSYKRASALMPFEIAAKLQGFEVDMPVRLSDEAILAWHEADTKHRAEWRRMSHRVSGIKGSATKRARRLEASKKATEATPKPATLAEAPAVQPVRIYPVVTMVEQPSANPIVTYQDAISHTVPAFALPRPPQAWQVFWSQQNRMRRLSRQSVGPELKDKAAAKRRRKAEAWVYNLEMTRVAREIQRLARRMNEKALADLIEIVRGGR